MEEKERLTVSTISRSEEIEDKNYCNKLKENLEKYFTIWFIIFSSSSDDKNIDNESVKSVLLELENSKINALVRTESEKDKINFPKDRMILILIAFVTLIVISVLKGSAHVESIIKIKP